ncbi:hypothetical protein AB1Y20_004701 [Prymnesium parvum]|uniref:Hydroxyproline O-arabinosyltransferase-like domain-containing protein n=1 Tax=Prymnesium parvum TaxID=97485 RepID=A0AB34IYA6_PRYPA
MLRTALAALTPFALIALIQFARFSNSETPWERVKARARAAASAAMKMDPGPAKPFYPSELTPTVSNGTATQEMPLDALARPAAMISAGESVAQPASEAEVVKERRDVARDYPPPKLSRKPLLDGSKNYLPVPNAESSDADDLAWRKSVVKGTTRCPPNRRPFHTILTAQQSLYQQWQTKIFYYHFKKAQAAGGPCTEMVGFTRLLAGRGDNLMESIPTVAIGEVGHDKTRGFMVINRPWTLQEFVKRAEFSERIKEDYVYIAETDHLLLKDIPNRATPELNVAFFFPYMSPVPAQQSAVVKRYYTGDHLDVQPVGGSPAIMHVNNLKKLAPLWFDLSVELKADREADRAFGWVLEMWGYSLACARLGVKHFVWQQLQIEPSSAWHQDVSAEDPFIYHYTFGVEYSREGVPVVGSVGEWSLDKRHYFGAAPPDKLEPPPACAQECAWTWWRMFSEAIGNLSANGQWYDKVGQNTNAFAFRQHASFQLGTLGKAIVSMGPWKIGSGEVFFYRRGTAFSTWGSGTWTQLGDTTVELTLCKAHKLDFDSASSPRKFTYESGTKQGGLRDLSDTYGSPWADAENAVVAKVLGEGPWRFNDREPLSFLWGGVLDTPWGRGKYAPIPSSDDLQLTMPTGAYRMTLTGCYTFKATRDSVFSSGSVLKGWIPMKGVSMEYTHWRGPWRCDV